MPAEFGIVGTHFYRIRPGNPQPGRGVTGNYGLSGLLVAVFAMPRIFQPSMAA